MITVWDAGDGAVRQAEQWDTQSLSFGRMAVRCDSSSDGSTPRSAWQVAAPLENSTDIGVFDGTGALCTTVTPAAGAAAGPPGMAMACAWVPGAERLVLVAHEDGTVRGYDTAVPGRALLATPRPAPPAPACTALAVMPRAGAPGVCRCVVGTAGACTSVLDVDAAAGVCTRVAALALPRPGVGDAAVRRADGRVFATAGWDRRVRLYALGCGSSGTSGSGGGGRVRPLATLRYHTASATSVDFAPAESVLASAARDTCIALWKMY